jgi:hypothetical protein
MGSARVRIYLALNNLLIVLHWTSSVLISYFYYRWNFGCYIICMSDSYRLCLNFHGFYLRRIFWALCEFDFLTSASIEISVFYVVGAGEAVPGPAGEAHRRHTRQPCQVTQFSGSGSSWTCTYLLFCLIRLKTQHTKINKNLISYRSKCFCIFLGMEMVKNLFQCCGSALVSMLIWIRIQGAKPVRIRILVRLKSHKKFNFYMKNVL